MIHLFYLIGINYFFKSILSMSKPLWSLKRSRDKVNLINERKRKEIAGEELTEEEENVFYASTPLMIRFLWLLAGLTTFNWPMFLFIILISFFVLNPLAKLVKGSDNIEAVIYSISGLIGVSFYLFAIINQYHLRIDLYALLVSYF